MSSRDRIIVEEQFRGPPFSGNGGYVAGLMAADIPGAATVVLRAIIPLNAELTLIREGDAVRLISGDGALLGEAHPAAAPLSAPPPAPSLEAARRAGAAFPGLTRTFHPVCFCCAPQLDEGYGLRVFVGQTEGADPGHVSGVWSLHPRFAGETGAASPEIVWAALDCPGSVAWVVRQGDAGLLGTMTCAILRPPRAGEPCIVTAWPIEQSGRKRVSGTALFTAGGELLAHSYQVWIVR